MGQLHANPNKSPTNSRFRRSSAIELGDVISQAVKLNGHDPTKQTNPSMRAPGLTDSGKTIERADWKAPLTMLRAMRDEELNDSGLGGDAKYKPEDEHICFDLVGFGSDRFPSGLADPAYRFQWLFRFEFKTRQGDILYTSGDVGLLGYGNSEEEGFMGRPGQSPIVQMEFAFQENVKVALQSGKKRLTEIAKAELEKRVSATPPPWAPWSSLRGLDYRFRMFRTELFSDMYVQEEKTLGEYLRQIELSRVILRSYLAFMLPDYFRRNDDLRLFIEHDTRDGTSGPSQVALTTLRKGLGTKACGQYFGGHSEVWTFQSFQKGCKDKWVKSVSNMTPYYPGQWRFHFDLLRSYVTLKELQDQLR